MQFILKHHKPTLSRPFLECCNTCCGSVVLPSPRSEGDQKSGIGMAEAKTEAPTSDANLGWCDIQIGLRKKIEVNFYQGWKGLNRSLVFW